MKKILVISNGPFPTPEQDKVEGGGLRCWGLASGLKSQKNLKVVAAYNEAFKKYNITRIMLRRDQVPVKKGWRKIYQDQEVVILEKE